MKNHACTKYRCEFARSSKRTKTIIYTQNKIDTDLTGSLIKGVKWSPRWEFSAVEDVFSDYNILAANKVSNTTHCAQGYWIFGCYYIASQQMIIMP